MSLVARAFADHQATVASPNLGNSLEELNKYAFLSLLAFVRIYIYNGIPSVLIAIAEEIEHIQNLKPSRRFTSFLKDPEKIQGMEKDLEKAVSLFHVSIFSTNCLDLSSSIHAYYIDKAQCRYSANSRCIEDRSGCSKPFKRL